MPHLRRWGAVYLLTALFLLSWGGQFAAQLTEFTSEQAQHGQPFQWAEFWPAFLAATLENWESEFLQLAVQALLVVGAARAVFRKSTEEQDAMSDQLDRIEAKVDEATRRGVL